MTDPAEDEIDPALVLADFESFYRTHYRPILRTALALTRDPATAEDLTQDAFIAARKSWARVGSYDRPDLWVRRVVINLSASRLRRVGREATAILRLQHLTATHIEPATPDPELWAAIAALSARQSQVIVLVVVEDLPVSTSPRSWVAVSNRFAPTCDEPVPVSPSYSTRKRYEP